MFVCMDTLSICMYEHNEYLYTGRLWSVLSCVAAADNDKNFNNAPEKCAR